MDWQMSQCKEVQKPATKWITALKELQALLLKILHNIALRPKCFFRIL